MKIKFELNNLITEKDTVIQITDLNNLSNEINKKYLYVILNSILMLLLINTIYVSIYGNNNSKCNVTI